MKANKIIQRRSLAEELAEQLQRQISSGEFKVGEKLPAEPELMKTFGVGRSTVREAVGTLVNLGLLKVQQGAGTFVESLTASNESIERRMKRADLHDLDEVRRVLEIAVAEKAAVRRTEDDIVAIGKYLSERKAAAESGLLKECIEADVNLHIAIARAAHNEILSELYMSLSVHLQKGFRHIYNDTVCFQNSQPTHELLVKCIINGEPGKALKTVGRILDEP